ncbi:MAG: RNA methyltransferase [Deltaproteobacteria bacterium]|nr:RNA methyltransferase [Deltaproteobacteria bacterium]
MKRVSSDGMDVFRPKGQLGKEIELASRAPGEVIRILSDKLSDERRLRIDDVVSRRTRHLTVAIEGVRDPHNTAAVIRTADAFGLQVVHVIERGDRFLSSRKVTQGAHKWVDLGVWERAELFAKVVRDEGKKILIATMDGALPLEDLDPTEPMALVFGNEHDGVSPEMREISDGAFFIPMFGFTESINVSAAAAITLAALRKGGDGSLTPKEAEILRARFYLRAVRAGYDIVMLEK